jgi:UDP-N-acetylmuramate-alanine ligase
LARGLTALSRFENVKRRLELRGTVGGISVYDDFAHHPTAVATTVAGLRRKVGGARILVVLEPRSNTMKLGTMKALLPASLTEADLVFCYTANLGWNVSEALAPLGDKVAVDDDLDRLVRSHCRRRTRRRSGARDEQRQLWRHPRQTAERPRRVTHQRRKWSARRAANNSVR